LFSVVAWSLMAGWLGLIAGVGVVSGALGSSQSAGKPLRKVGPPQTPVPLIAIHGRKDRNVPFPGGTGFRPVGRCYLSVLDSAEGWAAYCGCELSPEVDEDRRAGHRTLIWRDLDGNTWVVLHILGPWGHQWPGKVSLEHQLPKSHPLRAFEASEISGTFRDWSCSADGADWALTSEWRAPARKTRASG
jgi:poly(3-hydroxybutyrate) depolymerase